ncbi:MAG: tetratricopeptide repeat protein, partial [Acidobacteria bacterium]|nr:tetratricopeptide repeat protein [Acidobacteriota bacterium]
IIQRCLAKEPGQRYQRASEIRAALEALQSGTAIVAAPTPKAVLRRWWFWAVAVPLLLIGLGVVIAAIRGVPFNIGISRIERPAAPLGLGGRPCKPSDNPEANEYLQKGALLLTGQFEVPRARQMFEKALELDPHFADARIAYGLTFVIMLHAGYSNDPGVLYKAEEELRRALQDEPNCGLAPAILAGVYLLQGRKELVPGEIDRALKLDPNSRSAMIWSLLYHRLNGDYAEAQAIGEKLLEADPTFFPARTFLGELYREQGKLPDAIRAQEKVVEQDLTNILAIRHLARACIDQGDLRRARAALERARPQDRPNYSLRVTWALLLAREGKGAQALKEMDGETQKYAEVHGFTTADAAAFYAVLGDKEKALEWLDRAVRNGDERLEWFQRDPLLASVRNEPRFKQILESIAYRRQQRGRRATSAAGR